MSLTKTRKSSVPKPLKNAADATLPRRSPTQQRSRTRMDRILSIATELIANNGSDQMKMSDVAARAGISIGSLYQYFPDKNAIIRKIAESQRQQCRTCIENAFASVTNSGELEIAFSGLVDSYYGMFLAEPVMRDIWSGMQADKHLMDLELAESRICGEMLARAMMRAKRSKDPKKYSTVSFLIWQLGDATMRLAISVRRSEGDAIVEAYKRMALREILNA